MTAPGAKPALKVSGLSVCLDGPNGLRMVLRDSELTVPAARVVALVGESGSGKTCLVHSVLGLHPGLPGVVSGRVEVFGQPVFPDPAGFVRVVDEGGLTVLKDTIGWKKAVAGKWAGMLGSKVTVVSQDASTSLSPFHDIGSLLAHAVRKGACGLDSSSAREAGREWLKRVQMYDVDSVMGRYLPELSGGMAQRVAIAVALAPGPGLIIADEPTTGLDATLRIELISLMSSMVKERESTLLLVTHDMGAARLIADEVAVLYQGVVVETGPAGKVLDPGYPVKHPYTAYLLEAETRLLNGLDTPRDHLGEAAGEGCPCRGFCPRATARCSDGVPPLVEVDGGGQRLACWGVGSR